MNPIESTYKVFWPDNVCLYIVVNSVWSDRVYCVWLKRDSVLSILYYYITIISFFFKKNKKNNNYKKKKNKKGKVGGQ